MNILTKSVFAAMLLASTAVVAEEQYPAADFQPTVVYSDANATSSESSAVAANSSEAAATEEKSVEKAESSNTFLFGLVILAVAGGFFLSKKPAKCKAEKELGAAPSYAGEVGGLTGVEKYLQAKDISGATGVEKYLAKKEAADNEASLTGVDRYLRKRG